MADPAAIMADPAAEGSSEATERRRKRRWDSDGDGTGGGDAAAVPAAAPISDPLALTLAGAAGMQLALLPDAASAAQAAAIAAAAARAQASITVKLHINDALPSQRAILMRPKMQQDIASKSGATITMVGVPYEKAELPAVKKTDPPPVYLEVGANDQSQVDRAVAMIGEILSDTPLPDPRSLSEQKLDMQNFHRKKLFIGLDDANPGFSVIGKVLGPNGQYLRHITDKSMARVDLKGRGSRAWDGSDEGMHLEISSRVEKHVTDAEKLCTDLIAAVQQMYKKWNQGREPYRPPVAMNPIPPPMGGAGMPPPPNPSGLPPGWEEKKTKEGRVFYINHNDKTTSWKKPEMPKPPGPPAFPSPPVAPPAAAPPALPGGQAPPGAGSDAPACDGKEGEGHALPASGGADGPNQAGGAAQQGAGGAGGAGGQVQAPPPMGAGQPPGAGAQWGAPPQPGWGGGGGGGGGYGGYGGGGYGGFGGGWGAPQPPNLPPPPLPPAHAPPPPPGQGETAPQDAAGAAES